MPTAEITRIDQTTSSCCQPQGGRYSLMPTGPPRNSPSLRSRRGMHRRTVTGVSERTFARRNSSTNCLISHSPRTQRLVKEAVRDAGRPVADRRLDPAALHSTATFVDGWLQARPRDWLAQVGTVALDPRRGYASALIAPLGHVTVGGGTTSTPSGWPTRWPTRHSDR